MKSCKLCGYKEGGSFISSDPKRGKENKNSRTGAFISSPQNFVLSDLHHRLIMARMPQSYSMNAPYGPRFSLPPTPPVRPGPGGRGTGKDRTMATVGQLLLDIRNPALRENALLLLSKEIVSIYPVLSKNTLDSGSSNRVCNALALLQSVASHSETRIPFLNAHIPLYLYPFLMTTNKTKPYEYLRLTSLGVIGSLVKNDDTEVISFLLQTEIVPLCLRTMEIGSELSKTVSTFILQKIILDEVGLYYICSTPDRFHCVTQVLGTIVESLVEQPSIRLLRHIIRCYLRFSEDRRYQACIALRDNLPVRLKDGTFENLIRNDPITVHWLQRLLINLYGDVSVGGPKGGFGQ
ncbi:hypothetical protein KFK09_025250 [Dendrobium nobile]|uniref:Cell differentiation protein rcd1 n=1 Tax=Dendrobium nobile TaxID=94219 RepID=A0A8T3AG16_DENNO|nr:hypothetical protein KFK09_025250 [Dendrobium nobile]